MFKKELTAGLTNSILPGKRLIDKAEPIFRWVPFSAPLMVPYQIKSSIPTTRIIRDAEIMGKIYTFKILIFQPKP